MLKARRAKFPGSGSIARMRAAGPAFAATNSENNPTLAPISTKVKGRRAVCARSISAPSAASSSGSYICGVKRRFFSQPLSSGWSRIRRPQRSTSSAPAASLKVTSLRRKIASRSPSRLTGRADVRADDAPVERARYQRSKSGGIGRHRNRRSPGAGALTSTVAPETRPILVLAWRWPAIKLAAKLDILPTRYFR